MREIVVLCTFDSFSVFYLVCFLILRNDARTMTCKSDAVFCMWGPDFLGLLEGLSFLDVRSVLPIRTHVLNYEYMNESIVPELLLAN